MSTMCIDTASIEAKIEAISIAGFSSIELWYKDIEKNNLPKIKKLLNEFNLKVPELCKLEGWFEEDGTLMGVPNKIEKIYDECKKRLEVAADLNSEYIVALPSRNDRGFFAPIEKGAERYHKLLEIGKEFNVKPTLEFIGQSSQIYNIKTALDFINLVNHTDSTLIIDVFHIWRGGDEIKEFEKVPLNLISLLHLHDVSDEYTRDQYKDRHRIMPGDGILNLKKFLEIANKKGFKGDVSLGVYNHSNWKKDPYEVAQEGFEKMRNLMKQYE